VQEGRSYKVPATSEASLNFGDPSRRTQGRAFRAISRLTGETESVEGGSNRRSQEQPFQRPQVLEVESRSDLLAAP